jgi:hypothetical protein
MDLERYEEAKAIELEVLEVRKQIEIGPVGNTSFHWGMATTTTGFGV